MPCMSCACTIPKCTPSHLCVLILSIFFFVCTTQGAGDPGVTRPALSSDPSLDQASVAGALRTFIERVSDPSALPEFAALRVPAARDAVTSAALRGLADAYTSVYDAIFDEREGYDVAALAVAVRHTPAHVRVLLGST